jgi:hypothetical protein
LPKKLLTQAGSEMEFEAELSEQIRDIFIVIATSLSLDHPQQAYRPF